MTAYDELPGRQRCHEAQREAAAGSKTTPAATHAASPILASPQGSQTDRGQRTIDTHLGGAPVTHSPDGHCLRDNQGAFTVGGQTPPAEANEIATPRATALRLADPLLALLADALDDLERTRIANENRLRQLTRAEADSDGELRGFGYDLDEPAVARLAGIVAGIAKLEHEATLNLQRAMRHHPLGGWVKVTVGVGEKQAARLLAAIGDPYWNTLHDRPRTVSELWAYCGLHTLPVASHALHESQGGLAGDGSQTRPDQSTIGTRSSRVGATDRGDPDQSIHDAHSAVVKVAPTRARGQRINWSTAAKMRVFLIAESCMKNRNSPYRAVYDDGRAKYVDAVHQTACRRCGPSGKPAEAGTALSAGHQHMRAMRLVMKEVLKDLWKAAREIHGDSDG